jgi:hypothetical protein
LPPLLLMSVMFTFYNRNIKVITVLTNETNFNNIIPSKKTLTIQCL